MPVYESHTREYKGFALGQRLCAERQLQRLTLQDVAARCGLSPTKLSQIENDLHVLDVDQAHAIARALGTTLKALLPSDRLLPYQVTRYAEVRDRAPREALVVGPRPYRNATTGSSGLSLTCSSDGNSSLSVVPGQAPQFCYHHERQFAFVLKGRVKFQMITPRGTLSEVLYRGDCIHLRSDLPHCFVCLSEEPAEVVQVASGHRLPFSRASIGPHPSDRVISVMARGVRLPWDGPSSGCGVGTAGAPLMWRRWSGSASGNWNRLKLGQSLPR